MRSIGNVSLFGAGMVVGILCILGGTRDSVADSGSVTHESEHFVTASEDGSRVFIWKTRDTEKWEDGQAVKVWLIDYYNDSYQMKEIARTKEQQESKGDD